MEPLFIKAKVSQFYTKSSNNFHYNAISKSLTFSVFSYRKEKNREKSSTVRQNQHDYYSYTSIFKTLALFDLYSCLARLDDHTTKIVQ